MKNIFQGLSEFRFFWRIFSKEILSYIRGLFEKYFPKNNLSYNQGYLSWIFGVCFPRIIWAIFWAIKEHFLTNALWRSFELQSKMFFSWIFSKIHLSYNWGFFEEYFPRIILQKIEDFFMNVFQGISYLWIFNEYSGFWIFNSSGPQ